MTVTFGYGRSPELVQNEFALSGEVIPDSVSVEIPAESLTIDDRNLWKVGPDGNVGRLFARLSAYNSQWQVDKLYPETPEGALEAFTDWKAAVAAEKAEKTANAEKSLTEWIERVRAAAALSLHGYDQRSRRMQYYSIDAESSMRVLGPEHALYITYLAVLAEYNQRSDDLRAELAAADAKREADIEAAKQAAEADKILWIGENGSEYLRSAHANGYGIQRSYVEERAAVEHPGYAVDFGEKMEFAERVNPTPKALSIALSEGATVVWCTNDAVDRDYDDEPYEPREAIVIEKYLGKYTLYLWV